MTDSATPYRVLARKYRPTTFAELIGQEAMVRTLTNAIASGRIAHAFVLTGVRGVGKTTTARILARALNCVGPDGKGGPTVAPCGVCEPCRAIMEDRHVDVMEMDAASRTGIDDIREIIDGVRYRPVSARYKIYIIDEVHMLSKQAFNGLLKTLEEPPPDVKFIFATTEIHKVPVTVLSRCQRFSLPRVPVELLAGHYRAIAEKEGVRVEPAAIGLVARAANGSVRDGLSILDQAIALAGGGDGGEITEAAVRDMLGIADRGRAFALFEAAMRGDAAAALSEMAALYRDGADPLMVLQELLELTHFVTRLKIVPTAGEGDPMIEGDRARAAPLAAALRMPVLARAWQMLLKGVGEVQGAPSPLQAAEMVLVRLAYVAELPAPGDVVKQIAEGGGPSAAVSPPSSPGNGAAPRSVPPFAEARPATRSAPSSAPSVESAGGATLALAPSPAEAAPGPATPALARPQSFLEVIELFDRNREAVLRSNLYSNVHLVRFEPGRIEFRPTAGAPPNLANRLGQLLGEWTGARWVVTVSREEGQPTLREQAEQRLAALRSEAAEHPLVRAVLETFPGATIEAVRELAEAAPDTDGAEPGEANEGDEAS